MLKVGIVGAGFMGEMHFNVYDLLPDTQVVGVADIKREKAEELIGSSAAKAYGTMEEMLAETDLDIIDITLPTHLHCDYTVKAAEAGKHVLCEKPMALNMEQAERMIEATEKAGVKFMIGHCIRFWPEYKVLKEICDEQHLGELKSLRMKRVSPLPDWSSDGWLMDPEKSGGMILDLHIHDADYVLYLLGRPQAVHAVGSADERGWNHIFTNYHYNGPAVSVEGGWDFDGEFPFEMSYRAVFAEGQVDCVVGREPSVILYQGSSSEALEVPALQVEAKDVGGNISDLGGYYSEVRYFVECVLEDKQPQVVTPQGAKESVELILAEKESAEKGEIVRL